MKLKYIALIFTAIIALSGCSTTEKFKMTIPEGTKVYTPYNLTSPTGIQTSSGKLQVTLPSDMYCGYLLYKSDNFNQAIPIGLDYKTKRHTGTKVAMATGYTLTSVGAGGALIGGIAMLAANGQGDEDNTDLFGLITSASCGVALVGASLGMPANSRLNQTAYDYNFGYVDNQVVKIPALSTTLLNPNPTKDKLAQPVKSPRAKERKKASSGKTNITTTTSTKAKKSRSDMAKKVIGSYTGTGSLSLGRQTDETYAEIDVIIEYIDKNHVSVRIIENEEDYFDTPLTYEVKNAKKGGFTLYLKDIPEAQIAISKDGSLVFKHNKVNIDDTIYTLEIKATKEI